MKSQDSRPRPDTNAKNNPPSRIIALIASIVWVSSAIFLIIALLIIILGSPGISEILICIVAGIALWWSHSRVMTQSKAFKRQSTEKTKLYTEQSPVSQSLRFLNYVLDNIVMFVLLLTALKILNTLGLPSLTENTRIATPLVFAYQLAYFMIFESIWSKTPAKWLTQTRIKMSDGSKPPLTNIIKRSFARFIPFEAFTFLGSQNPIGLHDKLSRTVVTKD